MKAIAVLIKINGLENLENALKKVEEIKKTNLNIVVNIEVV